MENKICQSCGMPITSDEQLGTNKDRKKYMKCNLVVTLAII